MFEIPFNYSEYFTVKQELMYISILSVSWKEPSSPRVTLW